MRFLFTTIQSYESDFYGRVGAELAARGSDVAHLTYSRRSADLLRRRGYEAYCFPDEAAALGEPQSLDVEVPRIERRYGLPTIRDAYWTDAPCRGRSEDWAIRRTVLHFRVVESLFDRVEPDVVVPEVGTELIRTVVHHVALDRGVPSLFPFYTIFPRPLRLYVDTLHAPIVPPDEVRALAPEEREEVERFILEFTARRASIRAHRKVPPTLERARRAKEYVTARLGPDRDNEYLRPGRWAADHVLGWGRVLAARPFYQRARPGRPFVYFPLHDTDDYKIKRVIPHCADQASIVEQIADALPPGYDLLLKEHPLSIGRNPIGLLRRLRRRENIRLLHPRTSSHDLIERSDAVAVISSTVGLEALLYAKPVLTIGRPFYAGYGVTLDVDSFSELRERIPELLRFRPDRERILSFLHAAMRRCRPGASVMIDRSDENAATIASTLADVAPSLAARPAGERVLAGAAGIAPFPSR